MKNIIIGLVIGMIIIAKIIIGTIEVSNVEDGVVTLKILNRYYEYEYRDID